MKITNGVPDYVLHWEAYDNLYYKGDFLALIKLQKDYLRKNPSNPREKLMLADAYVYATQYQQAMKILKSLHKFDPQDTEFTHALVECLDKMGKNPKDYPFRRKVPIFESQQETADWCYNYLKHEGLSNDPFNLLFEMEVAGYVRFEEEQLVAYLQQDKRFNVHEIEGEDYPAIELSEWSVVHMPVKMTL